MAEITRKPLAEKVRERLSGALARFGHHPFSPRRRDGANGARAAGHRLVRGPDGVLYGVVEPEDEQ